MKKISRIDRKAWESLRELQSPGEPDIIEHLLAVYLVSASSLMESLLLSLKEKDGKKIKACAHSWKSASYGIGAKALGDLCQALEKTSVDDHAEHENLIKLLESEYTALISELKATQAA